MYEVYGFDECPWCMRAKSLLEEKGIPFSYHDIPTRPERVAWMDERGFEGMQRTLPKVYRNGELVGGYEDLRNELVDIQKQTVVEVETAVEWDDDYVGGVEDFS